MTATNKAFACVFNAPAEDHKVERVFVVMMPTIPKYLRLRYAREDPGCCIVTLLFFVGSEYSIAQHQSTRGRHAHGVSATPLPSVEASKCERARISQQTHTTVAMTDITEYPMFRQQAALIEQLIHVNQKLDTRLASMEATIYNKCERAPPAQTQSEDANNIPPARRRRTSTAFTLMDVWFTWYTQMPCMWNSTDKSTKHTRSASTLVIALMKLFIPNGFGLDEIAKQYPSQVLDVGKAAETELLSFLREPNVTARGAQNVLKSMRKLHISGRLNVHIRRYQQLQAGGCIEDPAPQHTNNTINLNSTNSAK
ncbi:hypothetical protein PHMEG_00017616 [Phytophthora megakarya]|uniref:Uncharacterized protein n=1 Tax=Phytophthora megakarya TaxID=4795 RepID=A0A225VY14_9STRA|nr:hypothetical protein PHMEG_00017616 [Phytophthora megakarya]